jgi:hypothetical protein
MYSVVVVDIRRGTESFYVYLIGSPGFIGSRGVIEYPTNPLHLSRSYAPAPYGIMNPDIAMLSFYSYGGWEIPTADTGI